MKNFLNILSVCLVCFFFANKKMDVCHSNEDELEIECSVRGVSANDLTQLKEQIALEQESLVLVPKRPHVAAAKNPKRELQVCGVKLNNVKKLIQENSECGDAELLKLKSRILHIKARLSRITYYKVVRNDLPNYLAKSDELLHVIHKTIHDKVSLDDSVTMLDNFNHEIPVEEDLIDDTEIKNTKTVEGLEKLVQNLNVSTQADPLNRTHVLPAINSENHQIASTSKLPQSSHSLKSLLEKEDISSLIELLNTIILYKSQAMTEPEIDYLSSLPTPPGRMSSQNVNQVPNLGCPRFQVDTSKPPLNFNKQQPKSPELDTSLGFLLNLSMFINRDPSSWGINYSG